MSAIKNIMNSADYKNMVIDPQQDKIMDLPRILFTDHIRGQEFEMDIKIPEPIRSITHHIDEILKNKALLDDDKVRTMKREEVINCRTHDAETGSLTVHSASE